MEHPDNEIGGKRMRFCQTQCMSFHDPVVPSTLIGHCHRHGPALSTADFDLMHGKCGGGGVLVDERYIQQRIERRTPSQTVLPIEKSGEPTVHQRECISGGWNGFRFGA